MEASYPNVDAYDIKLNTVSGMCWGKKKKANNLVFLNVFLLQDLSSYNAGQEGLGKL